MSSRTRKQTVAVVLTDSDTICYTDRLIIMIYVSPFFLPLLAHENETHACAGDVVRIRGFQVHFFTRRLQKKKKFRRSLLRRLPWLLFFSTFPPNPIYTCGASKPIFPMFIATYLRPR